MLWTKDPFFEPDDIAESYLGFGILALVIEGVSQAAAAPKCVGMLGAEDFVFEVDDLAKLIGGVGMFALSIKS